uniref:U6 snRNA-associated Sm-like protein LSm8 n=3 Tax=Glossina TaxID=7393 RepID=A0A1A9ZX70_GLOPL
MKYHLALKVATSSSFTYLKCPQKVLCMLKITDPRFFSFFYEFVVMASALEQYINHTVSIITADGRNFIGTLKGFDQTINVILDESHERVFSTTTGIEQIVLGLHIIRGDNIAVIGQIDETIDSRLDFANIRGEPLGPVVH